MDGWWPCAPGNVTVMHRARPTALSWRIPGYAHAGVRRSWGKCAIAFPSPTASASKGPAGLTLEPFSWLDHLVRPRQHRLRDRQAESLGGLEVDDQLVLDRRLHRKVGWLRTLEDEIDIASRAPKIIGQVNSVGQEAAEFSEETVRIDGRKMIASRQRCDLYAMSIREAIRHHDKATIRLARLCGND